MISDALLIDGQWWMANSDIKFNGKLTFNSKEGGTLKIFGSAEPFMKLDTSRTLSQAKEESSESEKILKSRNGTILLLGDSIDGKKITVLASDSPEEKSIMRKDYSYCEREFRVQFIFLGIHFEKVEDVRFEYIMVEYSCLENWLSDRELAGRTTSYPSKSEHKYVVEHNYGKIKEFNINDICSIQMLSHPDITIKFGEEKIRTHLRL
jgi:ApeA-like protein